MPRSGNITDNYIEGSSKVLKFEKIPKDLNLNLDQVSDYMMLGRHAPINVVKENDNGFWSIGTSSTTWDPLST